MSTDAGDSDNASVASASSASSKSKRYYRTVFVSDVHLGTKHARADLLLDFLKNVKMDQLYLVGDIVDGWQLKRSWFWDVTHNDVIRRVLKLASKGVDVVYIPGNHDEGFREFTGHDMAGVRLAPEATHTAADGKRYWVLHGDVFDSVVAYARWLAYLGDYMYTFLLNLNRAFNFIRRKLGMPYWSLSAFLKHKVKNAVEYIGQFEKVVTAEAARRGVDGVICGHIHHAEIRQIGSVTYMNDGDWVESCTALAENADGTFELIYWADEVAARIPQKKVRKKKPRPRGDWPVAAE